MLVPLLVIVTLFGPFIVIFPANELIPLLLSPEFSIVTFPLEVSIFTCLSAYILLLLSPETAILLALFTVTSRTARTALLLVPLTTIVPYSILASFFAYIP